MRKVGIAAGSQLAADAGANIAEQGGNAVDAAIAATFVSAVTAPGLCSLFGFGGLTIWPSGGDPVTIEGAAEMPGRGLPSSAFGRGKFDVVMKYGGGTPTSVGPGTVATPGLVAACCLAQERFGRLPLEVLIDPAYQLAKEGYRLPAGAREYMRVTHEAIFGWHPDGPPGMLDEQGALKEDGAKVLLPHLDQSLELIAKEGPSVLYRGRLGERITEHVSAGDGILTTSDLSAYRARAHDSVRARLDDWDVATFPAPSVGGASLAAMLLLMKGPSSREWTAADLERYIRVQETVSAIRTGTLDVADDLDQEIRQLLTRAASGELLQPTASSETVHHSAVDSDGLGCAVTMSAGYGSGVVPPETGIWLNNQLGELELNRRGYHALAPGKRLSTNMSPTVARRPDGAVLAIGSPGAGRITTAIAQTMINFVRLKMDLEEAVACPRLHVEQTEAGFQVAHEPGLAIKREFRTRPFDQLDLFFGGVGAALYLPTGGFVLAPDPRRAGGTAIGVSSS